MPTDADDLDDFFGELSAVADQVEREVSAAPTASTAASATASATASDTGEDLMAMSPAPAVAPTSSLDDFFSDEPVPTPATSAVKLQPALAAPAADPAAAATAPPTRQQLLCSLSLAPREPGAAARTGSHGLMLGPSSWCKLVLQLNEPRQTVETQSWQLPPLDAEQQYGAAGTEGLCLTFWQGRSPPTLGLALWFTPGDADNSVHPDDEGATATWQPAGEQTLPLSDLPVFTRTIVSLDDLSEILTVTAAVSVRPTDCEAAPDPDTKHPCRDAWGFTVDLGSPAPPDADEQVELEAVGRHHRRSMQWQRALRRATHAERTGADGATQREYRHELRRLCQAGIPSPHRGHAWYVLSGAQEKAALAYRSTAGVGGPGGEFHAKLAEAREEIDWYASGGAARLRAKSRATVLGGARLCGASNTSGSSGGGVDLYTAALVYSGGSESGTDQPGFGMRLHASSEGDPQPQSHSQSQAVVASVAAGGPASHAGVQVGDIVLSVSADSVMPNDTPAGGATTAGNDSGGGRTVVLDGFSDGDGVAAALRAAQELVLARPEGSVTYWRFRSVAQPPTPAGLAEDPPPPPGTTYAFVHGTGNPSATVDSSSNVDDATRRRAGEALDLEALSVERAITAAADLLMEASAYQANHGGPLTDEADDYGDIVSSEVSFQWKIPDCPIENC